MQWGLAVCCHPTSRRCLGRREDEAVAGDLVQPRLLVCRPLNQTRRPPRKAMRGPASLSPTSPVAAPCKKQKKKTRGSRTPSQLIEMAAKSTGRREWADVGSSVVAAKGSTIVARGKWPVAPATLQRGSKFGGARSDGLRTAQQSRASHVWPWRYLMSCLAAAAGSMERRAGRLITGSDDHEGGAAACSRDSAEPLWSGSARQLHQQSGDRHVTPCCDGSQQQQRRWQQQQQQTAAGRAAAEGARRLDGAAAASGSS